MTADGPQFHPAPDGPGHPPHVRSRPSRMGWRTFVPLGVAAVVAWLWLWPFGGVVEVDRWSRQIAEEGAGEPFELRLVPGVPQDALEERAGIRWVDIRIALFAGRSAEADSLVVILASELADEPEAGEAVRRIDALAGAELSSDRRAVERAQDALAGHLGPGFEEAVVLESLRRAARTGLADLAAFLVHHPLLGDGEGEDLDAGVAARLEELGEGQPTMEEFAEIQEIVSGILRRRAG